MDSKEITVWVDASSVATGVALETNSTVIEDTCWLRPINDAQHINLAEHSPQRNQFGPSVGGDSVTLDH